MADKLDDITPLHEPISLLREALRRAEEEGAVACCVVLVHEDKGVWCETNGHSHAKILWGLETAKLRLLTNTINEIVDDALPSSG